MIIYYGGNYLKLHNDFGGIIHSYTMTIVIIVYSYTMTMVVIVYN